MIFSKKPGAVRVWRSGDKWLAMVNGAILPGEFDTEGAVRGAIRAELARTLPTGTAAVPERPSRLPNQRMHKLDEEQKATVIALIEAGQSVSNVAYRFGVHPATIYRYLTSERP